MRTMVRPIPAMAMVLALASVAPGQTKDRAVQFALGDKGLTSLKCGGTEMLQDGGFRVTGAFFRKWDGEVYAADPAAGKLSKDAAGTRLTWTYPWGQVALRYTPGKDRLNLDVEITTNSDADTLVGIYVQLMELKFAKTPAFDNRSFLFYTPSNIAHNLNSPGVVGADCDGGVLAMCNEQVGRPLCFGYADPSDGQAKLVYPVLAYTARHPTTKERFPFIERFVYPGGRDHWCLSVRFARPGGSLNALTADLHKKFADTYRPQLAWKDRRPIGRLFISTSPRPKDKVPFPPPGNPRGWFNDRKVDVTTEEGIQTFQERALEWAQRCAKICKDMDAQGIVLWDVEGQEQPHMISYLGDPRSLPPEMEPIADELFKKFTDAGLRTGLCIRPQRPMRPIYGKKVSQVSWAHRSRILENLVSKIKAARKRWGCTLFYMDSNITWIGDPVKIPGAASYSAFLDDQMLQELTVQFPDCLILPEHDSLRSYAYAAPYSQLNHNKLVAPPSGVLLAYPKAFFVNCISPKEAEERHAEILNSVRRGDILFFDGWYASKTNAAVKGLYEEAAKADK